MLLPQRLCLPVPVMALADTPDSWSRSNALKAACRLAASADHCKASPFPSSPAKKAMLSSICSGTSERQTSAGKCGPAYLASVCHSACLLADLPELAHTGHAGGQILRTWYRYALRSVGTSWLTWMVCIVSPSENQRVLKSQPVSAPLAMLFHSSAAASASRPSAVCTSSLQGHSSAQSSDACTACLLHTPSSADCIMRQAV